jgi:hypothetical protein
VCNKKQILAHCPRNAARKFSHIKLAKVKHFFCTTRYNVGAWLELDEQAGALVHPQHEIRVEIAKWLVSILCRGPQSTSADYPRHMLLRKMEMAQRQLAVLDVVDPGK